ncbi:conserved oligomeric Golgi complex subunit 1-like [Rhopilema esculentum]|uniref:conserved oligomeric Golgi complex subunit 1-like n=1 Tax=Rhopilema esculentum TaxID=499914 RepID=UPI0031E278BA
MEKGSEVDILFKTCSIEEIKDAEKNLRGAIEKKKEDLRLMVGERYRDLINAADTISLMKDLSQDVYKGLNTIQACCKDFKNRTARRRRTTSEDIKLGNEEINFYALATQMELLVDTPEKIWDALDRQDFMVAAQLYLLGHHIVNNSLHMNTGYGNQSDVFANFPVLHHQWAAISHFKESILKGSLAALKEPTLPDKALAESLCSIILLSDSSPRQVFVEFLLARKAAIQDLFHPSHHKTSIKRQICDVTSLIVLTLQQIFSLFYHPDSQSTLDKPEVDSLLYKTINEATKKKQPGQGESLQWLFGEDFDVLTVARHLPPTVLGFRPKIRNVMGIVPQQKIRDGAKEWLTGCINDVHVGVARLLEYIKSVKGLASIRDTVYELLSDSRLFGAKSELSASLEYKSRDPDNWNHLCEAVLDRQFTLWDELFERAFFNRAKAVLEEMLSNSYSNAVNCIDTTITEIATLKNTNADSNSHWDRNVTSYLWSEMPGDLPTSGWCMETNQNESQEISSLSYKARGCTPSVQTLCKTFDTNLADVVKAVKYLFESGEQKDIPMASKIEARGFSFEEDKRIEPFRKFSSATEAQGYIQESTSQVVKRICAHIQESLNELKSQLVNTNEADDYNQSLCIDRITFFGRLCSSIPEHCKNLIYLTCGFAEEDKTTLKRAAKQRPRKGKQPKTEAASCLDKVKSEFAEQQKTSFSIWKEWVVQKSSSIFQKTLFSAEELTVYGTTCWEDITIEEEADTGSKVQSKIRVPSQVSSFLISLLFRLCEETNRIGGHVLEKSLIRELTYAVGDAILFSLEDYAKNQRPLSQNRALQLVFDVKFLILLIAGNTDTKDEVSKRFKKRGSMLVNTMESFVDPFDLDVFTPHMTNFVNKQLQKSCLLLGTISNIDKHTLPTLSSRTSSMSQEQYNVVPFSPNPVRFMLLPISAHQEKSSHLRIEDFELEKTHTSEANEKLSIKSPLFEHLRQYTLDFDLI